MLLEMYEGQNSEAKVHITMKTLPKIGYIAFLDNNPVAAGFLRKIEGNVAAQLDGLVSNPYLGSIIRHDALNKIVKQLIEDAKALKLQGIYAFTVDKSVLLRSESFGFKVIDQSVIALSFSKE